LRIVMEASMVDETAKPIAFRDIARRIKPRDPIGKPPTLPPQRIFLAGGGKPPSIKARGRRLTGKDGGADGAIYEITTEIGRAPVGVHAFGPRMRGKKLLRARQRPRPEDHVRLLAPYVPNHLAIRPRPAKLPAELRIPKRFDPSRDRSAKLATTVFPPDDRYTFNDTAYPWSTVGRVDTANGQGSGVMVGPRHLLTASHMIDWKSSGPFVAGWLKFTPSYFDGSAPFGAGWSSWVYWDDQVKGPTIDGTEEQYDYVCLVLDNRIGDLTGWMGTRRYTDSWDGGDYWSHIGYPGDLASGARPSFQGGFALDGSAAESDDHEVMTHQADVWPGQSGGPMFGWWSGDVGPRVVSLQSWQNATANGASGGGDLVDLVIQARQDFP
jgi:V8-like Glu-specific endopeptidase